jgi:hypothetical protein
MRVLGLESGLLGPVIGPGQHFWGFLASWVGLGKVGLSAQGLNRTGGVSVWDQAIRSGSNSRAGDRRAR